MFTISFSQYEWTDSLTDAPNKIIINNIHIPFMYPQILIKQIF